MNTLNFEAGLVAFSINGKCEVSFNPTDSAFVEQLFNTFESLDARAETYKAEAEMAKTGSKVFELARKRDTEMRELIDSLFEKPVCAEVFGGMNVYAMAEGLPVWCNFLLAIMDEVDTTLSREQKATNPRIAKYTARYKR